MKRTVRPARPAPATTPPLLAVVPLAILSAVGTYVLTGSGAGPTQDAAAAASSTPSVAPAAYRRLAVPPVVSATAPAAASAPTVLPVLMTRATAGDIPDVALAAYQRAESVIDAADPGCRLSWQLLAAIGRVESDHGRARSHTLDAQGRETPALEGPRLDGTHGTSRVLDTDAGAEDGDRRFDHAVGPMQFLPATWAVTGVDADGDGTRDPQDIDDASLAAAVYLCAGPGDLATDVGRRAAVLRYNHSASYVTTVLSIMRGYQAGAFSVLPITTVDAGYIARSDATSPDPSAGVVAEDAATAWVSGHGPRLAWASHAAVGGSPLALAAVSHQAAASLPSTSSVPALPTSPAPTTPSPGVPGVPGVPEPTDAPTGPTDPAEPDPAGPGTTVDPCLDDVPPVDPPGNATADPTGDYPTPPVDVPTDPAASEPSDPTADASGDASGNPPGDPSTDASGDPSTDPTTGGVDCPGSGAPAGGPDVPTIPPGPSSALSPDPARARG